MKSWIPNAITSMNLIIGCLGIYAILTGSSYEAIYFVLAAGLLDFADGFAARMLNVQSAIGKELDSLADLVSFGLLPSFFMLNRIGDAAMFEWVALLIAVFSAIRLAKFNIDESQSDSFKGLPTPANAIMLTSLIFVPIELYDYTLISICLLSALLLVSPIRLLALKFTTYGWQGNQGRWLLILATLLGLVVFHMTFIPFVIPLYLLISIFSFMLSK